MALLIGGWLGWLAWTGRIGKPDGKQIAAILLAVVGGAVAAKGNVAIGGAMVAGGLYWLSRRTPVKRAGRVGRRGDAGTREALELLGLSTDADRAAVIAAHRRLIMRNHPDAGGTEALAQSLNAARDHLLARLP
ncbi:MAG: molecular chaperone DnaJ [Sphingobium sp.]